jgi:predicted nucleotidyltransferase
LGSIRIIKGTSRGNRAFTSDRGALQRLTYSDQATGFSVPVDLIPFRDVTSADSMIEWPPSRDIVMNVAGFEEALASSVPILIEENLILHVASIPGLMLLKFVAWSDRGRETDKDAADIYQFLTTYADAATLIASMTTKWIYWKRSVLTCKWRARNCWAGT